MVVTIEQAGPNNNNVQLLQSLLCSLRRAGIIAWVFGGWAAELWQTAPPRPHHDIDLLYPARDFSAIERFIGDNGLIDVVEKRFSHKRACEYDGILVEFFLLKHDVNGYYTDFPDGRATYRWPADVIEFQRPLEGSQVNVASVAALEEYRLYRERIREIRP